MKTPLFCGVCTAMVTPFLGDKVNYPMMEMLLKRQMDAGIEAAVICGTTGESATLSDEEKLALFRRCKEYVGNQMKIIAGTGANATDHAIFLSQEAERMGVDGLLIVTPYYNKTTQEGLIVHYQAIAEAVSIPIILYNVPSRTGMDISVPVCQALSKMNTIVGIKEASTDIRKISQLRNACGEDFSIWSGNDDMITPVLSLGGKGVISVLSNLLPVETNLLVSAGLAGDFDTAAEMQLRLLPLIDSLFCEVNPIPIKEAMAIIGYDCGPCRLPLVPMKPENAEKLRAFLRS